MVLCPGKCGCWIRVRLLLPSGFVSKTKFSYMWDLQTQGLCIWSEDSPHRRKRSRETVRTFAIRQGSHLKNTDEGTFFYRFIQMSSSLSQKKGGRCWLPPWKEVGVWAGLGFLVRSIPKYWQYIAKYILQDAHYWKHQAFAHKRRSSQNPSRDSSQATLEDSKNFCKTHSLIQHFHVFNYS